MREEGWGREGGRGREAVNSVSFFGVSVGQNNVQIFRQRCPHPEQRTNVYGTRTMKTVKGREE